MFKSFQRYLRSGYNIEMTIYFVKMKYLFNKKKTTEQGYAKSSNNIIV